MSATYCLPRVERALQQLQKDGRTGKTLNGYVETLEAFCNWCIQRGYLAENPLRHFTAYDETPKTVRRALTQEEFHRILNACDETERLINVLLYVPSHTARMFDTILDRAGVPKVTAEGKLDFHALRLAYITLLFENGATVKEAQTLARHANLHLTLDIYTRTRDKGLHNAVENLAASLLPAEEKADEKPN